MHDDDNGKARLARERFEKSLKRGEAAGGCTDADNWKT
jgi:hypothetical protein